PVLHSREHVAGFTPALQPGGRKLPTAHRARPRAPGPPVRRSAGRIHPARTDDRRRAYFAHSLGAWFLCPVSGVMVSPRDGRGACGTPRPAGYRSTELHTSGPGGPWQRRAVGQIGHSLLPPPPKRLMTDANFLALRSPPVSRPLPGDAFTPLT